ncbi:hypothetical protein FEM48_Zijuj09G0084000 [Ziziphus jujuba var. spinosa]|uniref:E3 ubiquitin-protein ligase CHIP n=1 Tax=Ziziphus jujuba var. spinosa TaxID=714518 RepID=A0A978URW9_ZIZJJ|nr:hypothetical protein FEM48_Zijuj09G0084000 [Ziziphus jujuba var. spinosa]
MGPSVALSPAKQAEQLKKDGNVCFKKDRFRAAIDAYTEAITLCPNVPVYWTNRALCHLKRNDWTKVEEDCRKAVQLDNNSVKVPKIMPSDVCIRGTNVLSQADEVLTLELTGCSGHYMLGLALLQRQEYAEGVKELEKALDLGRGADPKGYMVEEIWQELARAKYMEWEHESTKRTWELQTLKEACETALEEKYILEVSQLEGFLDEVSTKHMEQLESLARVFKIAAEADTPTEVPDYLCCKITLDVFRDPVITPSGVTYERSVILNHFKEVGNFDPVTREPLEESQLVPNLAIKEAVQAFLHEHGWAYKMD